MSLFVCKVKLFYFEPYFKGFFLYLFVSLCGNLLQFRTNSARTIILYFYIKTILNFSKSKCQMLQNRTFRSIPYAK
jgi:hypothetical protein